MNSENEIAHPINYADSVLKVASDKYGGLIEDARRRAGQLHRAEYLGGFSPGQPGAEVQARRRLEELPSLDRLRDEEEKFREAIFVSATEEEATLIVGTLLDGYPRGEIRPCYLEQIVETLRFAQEDENSLISAPVLYLASLILKRDNKFLPAIAEIVAACRDARAIFLKALTVTEMLMEAVHNADGVVYELAAPDDGEGLGGPLALDAPIPF